MRSSMVGSGSSSQLLSATNDFLLVDLGVTLMNSAALPVLCSLKSIVP